MNDKTKFHVYAAVCWIVAIAFTANAIMSESLWFVVVTVSLVVLGYLLWTWDSGKEIETRGGENKCTSSSEASSKSSSP